MQPEVQPSRLDRLIIDCAVGSLRQDGETVVILDDPDGALLDYLLEWASPHGNNATTFLVATADFRQATLARVKAIDAGLRDVVRIRGIDGPLPLDEFLASHAGERGVILGHLPKAHEELRYIAASVIGAFRSSSLILGANTKHMTHAQNEVLAERFSSVRGSRGSGKFRCILADHDANDKVTETQNPHGYCVPSQKYRNAEIFGVGGTFSGTRADRGGELLVETYLRREGVRVETHRVLDFGGGNGAVSLRLLRERSSVAVVATDVNADAISSMKLGLDPYIKQDRATVVWDDCAGSLESESFDAVLLNPPFHEGTTVDSSLVQRMLGAARRLLRRDGVLYLVFNSHLRYQRDVGRVFDVVDEVARNPKFTVLAARLDETSRS